MGMVVTISPSLSLYRIVVFPAASRPTIKILISFFPHNLSNNFENVRPMVATADRDEGQEGCGGNVEVQQGRRSGTPAGCRISICFKQYTHRSASNWTMMTSKAWRRTREGDEISCRYDASNPRGDSRTGVVDEAKVHSGNLLYKALLPLTISGRGNGSGGALFRLRCDDLSNEASCGFF